MIHFFKRIHFIGIGGAGMCGLAEMMINLGFEVSGSDTLQSLITERLNLLGARIYIGHCEENIKGAEIVVASSAIHNNNPEVSAAQKVGKTVIHRSDLLAELMKPKTGIAVAGTHGKTTTASLISTALLWLGLDPSLAIGGTLTSIGSNARLGAGDLFVCEADESDGSLIKLSPALSIITNIDKDHMDHYETLDDIIKVFKCFIDKIPFYGCLCLNIDDPIITQILPFIKQKKITYGLDSNASISACDIELKGFQSSFTPVVAGRKMERVNLPLPGRYNIQNSLAAFAVCSALNLPLEPISSALSNFQGVGHRFSIIGNHKHISVVDDYAHNPKKIQTVVSDLKESLPSSHICAIVQPHRYSRVKALLDEYSMSLKYADSAIILPIYSSGENPITSINHYVLADAIKNSSFKNSQKLCIAAMDFDHAIEISTTILQKENSLINKVFLCLGAGDIKNFGPLLYKQLVKYV